MARHSQRLNRAHAIMRRRQDNPVFEYFGNSLPCSHNVYSRRTMVVVGGMEVDADLVLHVQKTHFMVGGALDVTAADNEIYANDNRPYPKAGKKLSFCGRTFKIEAVEDLTPAAPDGKVKLVCVHWAT